MGLSVDLNADLGAEGAVRAMNGMLVPAQAQTVGFHGDNPAVLQNLRAVRRYLEAAGVAVRPV